MYRHFPELIDALLAAVSAADEELRRQGIVCAAPELPLRWDSASVTVTLRRATGQHSLRLTMFVNGYTEIAFARGGEVKPLVVGDAILSSPDEMPGFLADLTARFAAAEAADPIYLDGLARPVRSERCG